MNKEVTVIIPTWKPGRELTQLLLRLKRQSVPPERILIINTDEKYFREELIPDWAGISLLHIEKRMFDHAGTRDMGARMSSTPYLLFMTMDALPADTHLIERLLEAFEDEHTAAAYARQLPKKNCIPSCRRILQKRSTDTITVTQIKKNLRRGRRASDHRQRQRRKA